MSDVTPESTHFNFTRINSGEGFSKNGWSLTDHDIVKLDDILYAFLHHVHDGVSEVGDPTDPVTLTTANSGGLLPAATTYYYRASYVDKWGLETAASDEASITTPDAVPPPNAPAATVETTGGTIQPGIYSYLITFNSSTGGETTPGAVNNVRVLGGTTNRIRLDMGSLPTGASGYTVYRSKPGQSQFYLLSSGSSSPAYDTGGAEDQTITVPTVNTTNATNTITATLPGGIIPPGVMAWKLYRATAAGNYDGTNLVHYVVDPDGADLTSLSTSWVDTGAALLPGFPAQSSSTIPSASAINLSQLSGAFPLSAAPRGSRIWSSFIPGVLTNAQICNVTESPTAIQPVRYSAYMKTQPSGTGATPAVVRLRIMDSAATPNYVELYCAHNSNGYYINEYPLLAGATYEAESATKSDPVAVTTITDVIASNDQAVLLDTNGEYVEQSLGILEAGTYHAYSTLRAPTSVGATSDLAISAYIPGATPTVLGTTNFSLAHSDTYAEYTGPTFTAPGGQLVTIRVKKTTTGGQHYNVDTIRYSAVLPTLQAGTITLEAFVDNGTTVAADVNVSLWF